MNSSTSPRLVRRYRGGTGTDAPDLLAREEPLEIRLDHAADGGHASTSISVTMRTPGDDADLALGFLLTEGVVSDPADIVAVTPCAPKPPATESNVIRVVLADHVEVDLGRLQRHVYAASSCGVCGKTSLEAVRSLRVPQLGSGPRLDPALVPLLPDRLRAAQDVFERTGGNHAAGLFDADGALLAVREDVGRHNAVDKLLGSLWAAGAVPLHDTVLVVSGRASFELVQKALAAAVPVLAAVGAPSSLAVELAEDHGMTLLGFVRDGAFVAYAGTERLG